MMETKVKIIERVEQGEKMAIIVHSYNMNHLTRHDSKEQKQDYGTCEVCYTYVVDSNIEEAWKSDGETSQCVAAGSVSVSSPSQLNADSAGRSMPLWRLEEETEELDGIF